MSGQKPMGKPFGVVVSDRSQLPDDVITSQATATLAKWQQLSSQKLVPLEEVAWIGALFEKSFRNARARVEQAQKIKAELERKAAQRNVVEQAESKVHHVVLDDGVATSDGVG